MKKYFLFLALFAVSILPAFGQSASTDLISTLYSQGLLTSKTLAIPLDLHGGALTAGNLTLSGTGLNTLTGTTKVGTNGSGLALLITGSGTLSSGSVTITNANVTTGAVIILTGIGTTNAGQLTVGTILSGTSFGVTSTSGSDGRVFNYLITH